MLVLLAMIGLAVAPAATACPQPMSGLYEIVQDADLIVVGTVRASGATWKHRGSGFVVQVSAVLKGPAVGGAVEVLQADAPRPQRGEAGAPGIFFLRQDKEAQDCYVQSELFPGPVLLEGNAQQVFAHRIAELTGLLQQHPSAGRSQELNGWILRCLAEPATRILALLDLMGTSLSSETPVFLRPPLAPAHRAELLRLLAGETSPLQRTLLQTAIAEVFGSEELRRVQKSYRMTADEVEKDFESAANRRMAEEFLRVARSLR